MLLPAVPVEAQIMLDFESPDHLAKKFQFFDLTDARRPQPYLVQTRLGDANDFIQLQSYSPRCLVSLLYDETPEDTSPGTMSVFAGEFSKAKPLQVRFDASYANESSSVGVWISGLNPPDSGQAFQVLYTFQVGGQPPLDLIRFYSRTIPYGISNQTGRQIMPEHRVPTILGRSADDAPVWAALGVEYWVESGAPHMKITAGPNSREVAFPAEDSIDPPGEVLVGFRIFNRSQTPGKTRVDNIRISHPARNGSQRQPEKPAPAKVASAPAAQKNPTPTPAAAKATSQAAGGLALGKTLAFDFGPKPPADGAVHYNHIPRHVGVFGLFADTEKHAVPGVGLELSGAEEARSGNPNSDPKNYPKALGMHGSVLEDYILDSTSPSLITIKIHGLNPSYLHDVTGVVSYGARELGSVLRCHGQSIGLRTMSTSGATVGSLQGVRPDAKGTLVVTVSPSAPKEWACAINALLVKAVKDAPK